MSKRWTAAGILGALVSVLGTLRRGKKGAAEAPWQEPPMPASRISTKAPKKPRSSRAEKRARRQRSAMQRTRVARGQNIRTGAR